MIYTDKCNKEIARFLCKTLQSPLLVISYQLFTSDLPFSMAASLSGMSL